MYSKELFGKSMLETKGEESTSPNHYRVEVSVQHEDAVWDNFLAQTPGGHYVQTTMWARVKARIGWQAIRVLIWEKDTIIAGTQLLFHKVLLHYAVGIVLNGPVFAKKDPTLERLVLQRLHQVAHDHAVLHLVIQPPKYHEHFVHTLLKWNFQPSLFSFMPTAKAIIDLTPNLDTILARMKKKHRQNIRRSLQTGLSFREATEGDLPTFYRLYVCSSKRQGFTAYPEIFFTDLWRFFTPNQRIKIFVVEYDGEPVVGQILFLLNDTVFAKFTGWCGLHKERQPSEFMIWSIICWTKEQGYRSLDMKDIKPNVAKALLEGKSSRETEIPSWNSFKLGFGSQIVLCPGPYDYIYHPLLRHIYSHLLPKIMQQPTFWQILDYARTR